jgi:L-lactate dehydrogenase (cytochrome)
MIISAPSDYRKAAERRLSRLLFDYIDGGAVTERTMKQTSRNSRPSIFASACLVALGRQALKISDGVGHPVGPQEQ